MKLSSKWFVSHKSKWLIISLIGIALFSISIPREYAKGDLEQVLAEIPEDHFFPRALLKKYLTDYTAEELDLIYQDFVEIRHKTFFHAEKRPVYIATAGGPASGKTTLLENFLDTSPDHFAYIDPDRTCLPQMEKTYKKDLSENTRELYPAYVHWRAASNFIANTLLALALKDGYAIAHGTTMTASETKRVLASLRTQYRYNVTLWHLTCAENVRVESLAKRVSSGNVQCTPQDFEEKGKFFYQRLPDYVGGSDKIVFFYRSKMDTTTVAGKIEGGQLTVRDDHALQNIAENHGKNAVDFKKITSF